jgi:predicted Ser/Thr protein kinase
MPENPYAAADPLLVKKLGKCRLEKKLGEGGMGAVYLAKDGVGKEVAVKVLPPQFASEQEHLDRFFREIRTMSSVDHPNVVKVLDAGETDKIYWLVMEYVPGERLAEMLLKAKRIPFDRAARIVREIAKGLEAAHEAGVVHRDVKPQNVLVTRDGRPRLIDFGLAREPGKASGLTQEGVMLGTPEYMSPEQVEGKAIDARTDIYSLGITFYQLVTGKLPFQGENSMQMAMARVKSEPRELQNAFPAADPRAAPLIAKMMMREPGDRYQAMSEVIADIDKALAAKGSGYAPPKTATGVVPAFTREGRRAARTATFWTCVVIAAGLWIAAGLAGPRAAAPARGAEIAFVKERLTTPFGPGDHRNLVVALAGAGLLALLIGAVSFRKDLGYSGNGLLGLGLIAAGGVLGFASTATMTDLSIHAFASQVNRLALAVLLLGIGTAGAFRGWPAIWTDVCAVSSAALVYWAGAGREVIEPFLGIASRPEWVAPQLIFTFFIAFFGAIMISGEHRKPRTRWLGLLLSLIGVAAILVFSGTTASGGNKYTASIALGILDDALTRGTGIVLAVVVLVVAALKVSTGIRRADAYYGLR